jgi:hypothetical protein
MAQSSKAARNGAGVVPKKRVRAEQLNLTHDERALLPDPDWVTEDDADSVMARRAEREPGKRASLEQVLRENGINSNPRTPCVTAEKPDKQLRAAKK